MKTGKMAVMTGVNAPLAVAEYPVVPAAAGSVRLSLLASGVCGTDLHIHQGRLGVSLPAAIGHEFVGTIDDITPADAEKSGLRQGGNAIVCIAVPCGRCVLCENGDDANCVQMRVTNGFPPEEAPHFHGGYGEYTFAPPENIIPMPKSLDPTMAAVFACAGPTTIHAFALAKQANCKPETAKVAVVQGLGPVGMFAVLYLARLGVPHIIAVSGRENSARAQGAKTLGATHVKSLAKHGVEGVAALVNELSGGLGADLVFEGSGSPEAVAQGMGLLRNRGVYLIPGQYSDSGTVSILPQLITFKALQIFGSSQYSLPDVEAYLQFLTENSEIHENIKNLAAFYSIDQVNEALTAAAKGDHIKTLLTR